MCLCQVLHTQQCEPPSVKKKTVQVLGRAQSRAGPLERLGRDAMKVAGSTSKRASPLLEVEMCDDDRAPLGVSDAARDLCTHVYMPRIYAIRSSK